MKAVKVKDPLPEPSEEERAAIELAWQRAERRRPALKLGIAFKKDARGKRTSCELSPGHSDQGGWVSRLYEAFGTSSPDFVYAQISRIGELFRNKEGEIDTQAIEAIAAVLDGTQPSNEIEAMLVMQIATTHALTMKVMKRLSNADTIPQNDSASVTLARLQRTFTNQVETLAATRRGGKQKMTVEHVHIHPGAQAIVGNVTTGRPGGEIGNGQQPHVLDAERAAVEGGLWSEDAQRQALPVPSGDGQASLSDARRSSGNGRAKG